MSERKDSTDRPGSPAALVGLPGAKPSRLTMIMEIFGVSRSVTIAALLFALLTLAGAVEADSWARQKASGISEYVKKR